MGVILCRHHRCYILTLIVLALLLLFSSSATASFHSFGRGLGPVSKETNKSSLPGQNVDQKRLAGPGSVRPTCISKCGKCEPCEPVHIPIQLSLEYYPEVWRCKCGDKLFMP